ncbi:MAG TPA: addiction module protein [Thermoanaerobaculia bacterium]|nr:addiction module protein [Thermoanaerobaculia bacterium]
MTARESRGILASMKPLPVAEILELPVAERMRLVEIIWDSIAAVPEAVPVSDDLKADLDRRLAEFEADPEAGLPWNEVRERILQGRWRTD